jgi:hypothetical protein
MVPEIVSIPFGQLFGSSLGVGAGIGGSFYMLRWFIELMTNRVEKREARVDAGGDKLLTSTLGWADDLQEWGKGLLAEVAELRRQLDECKEEHSRSRAEMLELRAILDAKGIIAQQTQLGIAANRFADQARERGA